MATKPARMATKPARMATKPARIQAVLAECTQAIMQQDSLCAHVQSVHIKQASVQSMQLACVNGPCAKLRAASSLLLTLLTRLAVVMPTVPLLPHCFCAAHMCLYVARSVAVLTLLTRLAVVRPMVPVPQHTSNSVTLGWGAAHSLAIRYKRHAAGVLTCVHTPTHTHSPDPVGRNPIGLVVLRPHVPSKSRSVSVCVSVCVCVCQAHIPT